MADTRDVPVRQDLFGGRVHMPGGGAYGRSARREIRNPVLGLPAAVAIQALPLEQRRPLGILLRELAVQAEGQADEAWAGRKGIMAAYWRAIAIYAKHLARVIEPRSAGSVAKAEERDHAA